MVFGLPFVAGLVLGGMTLGAMALGDVLRQRGTWATTMVAIAAFYVVFAIQTGDTAEIIVHSGIAAGFAALTIIGARASAWILAAALLGHGIFDVSVGRFLANPASGWWGPFCLGIDVVLALGLAVLLLRERTLQ